MTTTSRVVWLIGLILIGLIFWVTPPDNSVAEKPQASSPSGQQQVLSLNFPHNGEHFSVKSGQKIVITLQTIGDGAYGTPRVSSPSVRFEETHLAVDMIIPAGPTQVCSFIAEAVGEAKIEIPHNMNPPRPVPPFHVTIQVKPT